jgi:hypothetical protein
MTQAKAAAVKAVQLDDSSAEAHASMGHIHRITPIGISTAQNGNSSGPSN